MAGIDELFSDVRERDRIRAEAKFGFDELVAHVSALSTGARVLEIGCGTGYLLAQLSQLRPDVQFVGLEPIGPGFAKFQPVLERILSVYKLMIRHEPIETFKVQTEDEKFDLVFSVNVFEHVSDWGQAVRRTVNLLKKEGRAVILCPNYAVPYEPHFAIPILLSPSVTHAVFSGHIERTELALSAQGLWVSLNFISVPKLAKFCSINGIDVMFDKTIVARMIGRLQSDPEFAKRQRKIAVIARLLERIGIVRLLSVFPAACSPYMKATLSRRQDEVI